MIDCDAAYKLLSQKQLYKIEATWKYQLENWVGHPFPICLADNSTITTSKQVTLHWETDREWQQVFFVAANLLNYLIALDM